MMLADFLYTSLNRTRVELKLDEKALNELRNAGLNRTRVELKLLSKANSRKKLHKFESNQSGIETSDALDVVLKFLLV